jgi:selT/selW/selH-like putative selenoprotein
MNQRTGGLPDGRHRLEFEFCQACKFGGRAFWLARELYDQRPDLADEFVLVPSSGGAFTVRYDGRVIFDYKKEDRFPEPKEIREAVLAASGRPPTPKRH